MGASRSDVGLSPAGTVNGVDGQTLILMGGGTLSGKDAGAQSLGSLGSLTLTNGTGTPFPAQAGGKTFILTQSLGDTAASGGTSGGGGGLQCTGKFCSGAVQTATLTSKRLTWVERR